VFEDLGLKLFLARVIYERVREAEAKLQLEQCHQAMTLLLLLGELVRDIILSHLNNALNFVGRFKPARHVRAPIATQSGRVQAAFPSMQRWNASWSPT
jgi:hypothetical protein